MLPLLDYPDLSGAMRNLVALEKQITLEVGSILDQNFNDGTAQPYMRYESAVYPKWLNGISNDRPDEFGIFENEQLWTISAELQLGKITQGYDGSLEQTLYVWLPYTIETIRVNPKLKSAAQPTAPRNLILASARVAQPLMPGDIIAARFVVSLDFVTTNEDRDF